MLNYCCKSEYTEFLSNLIGKKNKSFNRNQVSLYVILKLFSIITPNPIA